jgi:hypothetical protein
MEQEQYVTFETAKLLFKNGYMKKCRCYYMKDGERFEHCHQEVLPRDEPTYDCPTQAAVLRWLRERYKIAIVPIPYRYPDRWINLLIYLGEPMEKDDRYDMCQLIKEFPSYEEAAEYGIIYAVGRLVAKIRREWIIRAREEKKEKKDGGAEV